MDEITLFIFRTNMEITTIANDKKVWIWNRDHLTTPLFLIYVMLYYHINIISYQSTDTELFLPTHSKLLFIWKQTLHHTVREEIAVLQSEDNKPHSCFSAACFHLQGAAEGRGLPHQIWCWWNSFPSAWPLRPAAAETCQTDKCSIVFLTGGSFLSFLLWTAGGAADCWSEGDETFPTKREIISERPHGRKHCRCMSGELLTPVEEVQWVTGESSGVEEV